MIRLARACRRIPLIVYMRPAANVGSVTGTCLTEEEGCQPTNDHHNEYTHSKAIGESLVRDSGLPFLILRPTIVLSAGLNDAAFARQILWCVPVFRAFEALPLDGESHLDMIDVDFAAECSVRLLEAPLRRHDCYHISAGRARSVSLNRLNEIITAHYHRR